MPHILENQMMKGLIIENSILHWLCLFIISVIGIPCAAQSPEEIENKIDEIKLDESFIYGLNYNTNKDIAYQNALSELLFTINELREEKNIVLISEADLQPIIGELSYTNGTRNLSFLYLPLAQALSLAPKTREGVVATKKNLQNVQNQNIEPKQQEEKPKLTFVPDKPISPVPTTSTQLDTGVLETLCGQDNWVEIKGFLTSFKNEGKIKETGNCLSYAEVPDDAYAILMDEMGGILSIMSPKNSPNRINHKANQSDNENNHANCKFIVWYK